MHSNYITVIGGIAAALSTVSFVPQAVKIIRTRGTSAISTSMYFVTVLGVFFMGGLWSAARGMALDRLQQHLPSSLGLYPDNEVVAR